MPRREKNNPKTIEQIHREAQEEEQQRQAAIQRASIEQRTAVAPAGRRPAGNIDTDHTQCHGSLQQSCSLGLDVSVLRRSRDIFFKRLGLGKV